MVTLQTLLWQSLVFAGVALALALFISRFPGLRRAYDALVDLLAGLFLSAGLGVVLVSVFMRYVLNNPPDWGDEFARIFVAWGAMFGFSVALREGRHITVDLLYSFLPPGGKRALDFLSRAIGVLFSAFITVAGWHYVMFLKTLGLRSIYTDIPEWILTFILPLGFFFFTLQFALSLFDLMRGEAAVAEGVSGV